MASQIASGSRAAKLISLFRDYAKGKRRITSSAHARHFFEASDVFCQLNSPIKYVEVLIAYSDGIKALESSVRVALDPAFLISVTLPSLKNLCDPGVEALGNGQFLKQILLAILVPKTFWATLLDAHNCGTLDDISSEVFAWLCLQVVSGRDTALDEHNSDVQAIMKGASLIEHDSHQVRTIAYRIKKTLHVFTPLSAEGIASSAGGRHDNDFEDFRNIAIYPTTDELMSSQQPFLQRLDDVFDMPVDKRTLVYRDWLYRLLREDMLAELREDLQVAMGQKNGRRKPTPLGNLQHVTLPHQEGRRIEPFTLYLTCGTGMNMPKNHSREAKKKFLERMEASFRRQPIGALCRGTNIIAFGSLHREMALLQQRLPIVGIKFKEPEGLKKALMALSGPKREELKFYTVDTAMFAFEPILQRLKDMGDLPLENHIVDPKECEKKYKPPPALQDYIDKFEKIYKDGETAQLSSKICGKKISLKGAQLKSLIDGLREEVAQIQGPPGTGKSFIGALIILLITKLTDLKVLVLAYTNHATDQFMEDLMDIGVPASSMVRLGSKSTKATEGTLLKNIARSSSARLTFEEKNIIDARKQEAQKNAAELQVAGSKLSGKKIDPKDVLEYLEFSDEYSFYWHAFQIPESQDGFSVVGANNRSLQPEDLLAEWLQSSQNLQGFIHSLDEFNASIWQMPQSERWNLHAAWVQGIREERISDFVRLSERARDLEEQIKNLFDERDRRILKSKKIIACTTTAAAMYQSIINTANPDIIMVEEAGEILEVHIITAMSPSVKQLILIGDHKQLPPKINNYNLTKEKGDGYDLNVSLFERFVLQGHKFTTLEEQHRSHPEISRFSRMLAYESLKDAPKTLERERVRGLTSRVTFVHHEYSEDMGGSVDDWTLTSKTSRRNKHEAQLVLKLVRYLGQQGYTSDNIVVLTPYIGQLFLLKETLRVENDPYLNDLDSHDLVRAGLMSQAEAKVDKKALRLSTIGK